MGYEQHPRKENPQYELTIGKNNTKYWKRRDCGSPVIMKDPQSQEDIVREAKRSFDTHHLRKEHRHEFPPSIMNIHPEQTILDNDDDLASDCDPYPETAVLPVGDGVDDGACDDSLVDGTGEDFRDDDNWSDDEEYGDGDDRWAAVRSFVSSRAFVMSVVVVSFAAVTAVGTVMFFKFLMG